MLQKTDIKNGTFIYYESDDTYHRILDVNNAVNTGVRNKDDNPDELSYSTINLLTGKYDTDICEHSGMTQDFRVATVDEILLYFNNVEAEASLKLAKAVKKHAKIKLAINHFNLTWIYNND